MIQMDIWPFFAQSRGLFTVWFPNRSQASDVPLTSNPGSDTAFALFIYSHADTEGVSTCVNISFFGTSDVDAPGTCGQN